jgi:hypothetical protein
MKVRLILFSVVVAISVAYPHALAAPSNDLWMEKLASELQKTREVLKAAQAQGSKTVHIQTLGMRWDLLEAFQANLFRSMAMDPGPGTAPPSEVPGHLFAAALSEKLQQQFEQLRQSDVAATLGVQDEFSTYMEAASQILALRAGRKFPEARNIAKRGTLGTAFQALTASINTKRTMVQTATDFTGQQNVLKLAEQLSKIETMVSDANQASPFAGGSRFTGFALCLAIGLAIGLAARGKLLSFTQKDSKPQASALSNQAAAASFDYSSWLSEFEVVLARVRNSQQGLDRRAAELQTNSERLSQLALALYASPRTQEDPELEYRVSNILREAQKTLEAAKKVATHEKIPVQDVVLHSLKICDHMESTTGVERPAPVLHS